MKCLLGALPEDGLLPAEIHALDVHLEGVRHARRHATLRTIEARLLQTGKKEERRGANACLVIRRERVLHGSRTRVYLSPGMGLEACTKQRA